MELGGLGLDKRFCWGFRGGSDAKAATKGKNKQRQRRNAGISPLWRQSAPPSVEMTFVEVADAKTNNGKVRSRSLRNDKQKDNGNRRSFDSAARKSASNSAQDDTSLGWVEENRQRQRQKQIPTG